MQIGEARLPTQFPRRALRVANQCRWVACSPLLHPDGYLLSRHGTAGLNDFENAESVSVGQIECICAHLLSRQQTSCRQQMGFAEIRYVDVVANAASITGWEIVTEYVQFA